MLSVYQQLAMTQDADGLSDHHDVHTVAMDLCVARGSMICSDQRTCFVSQMPVAVHIRTFKPLHTSSLHICSVFAVQHEQNTWANQKL